MLVIETQDLTKTYDAKPAVDQLSIGVRQGEIMALLGPNGAGKTTTINVLCGLMRPDSGKAMVKGLDVVHERTQVRHQIGIVFQESVLYENLTAWENLIFHGRLYKVPTRELKTKCRELLEMVRLSDQSGRRVNTFSGGMKRRLALARSLIHSPSVLLLDEPTLGIDVQARNAIWEHIRALRDEGRGVLLCTNYMEEADELSDRVTILDNGTLVAVDTPKALKDGVGGAMVSLVVDELRDGVPERLQALGARDVEIGEDADARTTIELSLPAEADVLPALLDYLNKETRIQGVTTHKPSMNDVFLSLTGRGLRD